MHQFNSARVKAVRRISFDKLIQRQGSKLISCRYSSTIILKTVSHSGVTKNGARESCLVLGRTSASGLTSTHAFTAWYLILFGFDDNNPVSHGLCEVLEPELFEGFAIEMRGLDIQSVNGIDEYLKTTAI